MPLRKRSRSARPRRSLKPRRLRFAGRRRTVRRRVRRGRRTGGSVVTINPGRQRVITVKKTMFQAWPSFNAANTANPGGTVLSARHQYFYYNFDPAGSSTRNVRYQLDNVGGLLPIVGKVTSGGHAFPDWNGYAGLYQFFKVKYIKITHSLVTQDMTDGVLFPTMYARAIYDADIQASFGNGSQATDAVDKFLEMTRVKKMTFNHDSSLGRNFTYKVYPREWDTALLKFVKPGWKDFSYANIRNYGFLVVWQDVLGADQQVDVNVEWCLQFKTAQ